MRENYIPIIDLFAGPGGLGEGFSALRTGINRDKCFQIALSVEKDAYAHRTLELRSFFRQFPDGSAPEEYYQYLRNQITRDELFSAFPKEANAARNESMLAELGGQQNPVIHQRIRDNLPGDHNRNWVLIGGPPCQAYSVIGRSRMRSTDQEKFESDSRHLLYREYLHILAEFQPAIFVMENVRGILSSRHDGNPIFPKILADLRKPQTALSLNGKELHYNIYSLVVPSENPEQLKPADYIIRSEAYGIPQTRHRVILLGVRTDTKYRPQTLNSEPSEVYLHQVLGDLPPVRSSLSKHPDSVSREWCSYIQEILERPWFQQMLVSGKVTNNLLTAQVKDRICQSIKELGTNLSCGGEFIPGETRCSYLPEWFSDPRIGGVCNHTARTHMPEDLHRYLFAACYAEVYGSSPTMRDYPAELLPKHKNVRQKTKDSGNDEMFEDRFRVQVANRPATTIVAHISKDGHYNIHYDPKQCRSLTVREAARIQTFPDNYRFEGPRTQQFHQVGNAVPPLLARQIAQIVYRMLQPRKDQW